MSISRIAATMTFALTVIAVTEVTAAEIKVLSIPFKAPLDRIGPAFERETGHRLMVTYAPSDPLLKQIESGAPFDLVLTFPKLVDQLITVTKVMAGSRVDIARAGLGVAVRRGAAKPGTRSVEEFKQALLRATSIAYAAQGPSGVHLANVLDRLGVAEAVKPKLKPMAAGSLVVGPVARGEVEIGIVSIPFILADPGAELAGPLPAELQDYVHYSSGIGSSARDVDAARELAAYLRQPRSIEVMRSYGLEAGAE
jgi:molybdate transport system substrate-binding protein